MSFPKYAKYKDSGVIWLGDVPEHWTTLSLGRATLDKCDGPFGSGLKSEHYADFGVRVIRLQNIRRDGFDDSDEVFIDEKYFNEELCGHDVQSGDVLIAGLGDERNTVGRACVAPAGIEPAMVKADCFRFRLDVEKAHPEFVALQLTAGSNADAGILSSGSTRSRIPLSEMATRKLAIPPLPEQLLIASFLDRETSTIDRLVEEQRRLIELLKEKRQAVISHAVTKGLNPHAPLKPSGIEWLGDVPEHWDVLQSRRMFRVRNERARESDRQITASQKYGILYQTAFVELEGRKVVETIMGTDTLRRVEPNDFVISLRSFQGGIEWSKIEGSVTFHYVVLTPVKDVFEPFFAHLFKSSAYIQALRSTTNLIRDGQDLRFSHFVQVDLPVIPLQ